MRAPLLSGTDVSRATPGTMGLRGGNAGGSAKGETMEEAMKETMAKANGCAAQRHPPSFRERT